VRILFIPLDTFSSGSNESTPNRIRLLSGGRNKVIGVKRTAPFTARMPGADAYMKFLLYAAKTFFFGLKHRKEFDLIYCFELGYTMVGLGISLLTGKPCVRDCAGVTQEWLQRVKPPVFLRLVVLATEKIVKRFTRMNVVLSETDRRAYI